MRNQVVPPTTPSLTPQLQTQEIPQKIKYMSKSKLSIIILIFLFLTAIGNAGYFAYQNYQLQMKIEQLQLRLTTSPATSLPDSPENQSLTEFEQSTNVSRIPGANILITVVNENNIIIQEGTLKVSVEYRDFPDRNYEYSVNLVSLDNGLLALYPPPSHIPSTISIRVETPAGKKSDTLVIKNNEYWEAVDKTSDYVGKHQFHLNKSGEETSLTYSTKSDIKPDYSTTRTIKQEGELVTIDFNQCTQDKMRIDVGFGSTTIVIGGKKGSNCNINYGGEIENPNWDGSLPVTCEIPVNIGKISFSKTNYGVNFSPIENYCSK